MTVVSDPPGVAPAVDPGRTWRIRGRDYPVSMPSRRDPRLHLAAVIISLQVLGQTVLHFELSIAQILVSLGTAALLELVITFRRDRSIRWPASAMLTGNGVAFILRVPGTEHGDWWSLNGWYFFAGCAAVSLLSKYLIRCRGRHIFNPSNFGLVLCFLLLGSDRVEPLDFWWGPLSPATAAALVIIVVGGLVILTRIKMLGMAAAFWLTFAAGLAVLAAAGHCMTARWRFGAVCDGSFWWVLVTSPEILVFTFFMITDPKTTPTGRVARVLFGVAVAVEAVLFVAPQQTEFATKVAVLGSLLVICAVRPFVERWFPAAGSTRDSLCGWLGGTTIRTHALRAISTAAALCLLVAALVSLTGPTRVPLGELQAISADVARPQLPPDLAGAPKVVIDPSVLRIDADLTDDRAAEMARDGLDDLRIEAMARQAGDRGLATTALGGARLDATWDAIARGREQGQITASTYAVESLRLVLVYDTVNRQAGPQYGLEVRGRETRTTYEGSTAKRVIAEQEQPFDRTFALLHRSGHYLLAADYPA